MTLYVNQQTPITISPVHCGAIRVGRGSSATATMGRTVPQVTAFVSGHNKNANVDEYHELTPELVISCPTDMCHQRRWLSTTQYITWAETRRLHCCLTSFLCTSPRFCDCDRTMRTRIGCSKGSGPELFLCLHSSSSCCRVCYRCWYSPPSTFHGHVFLTTDPVQSFQTDYLYYISLNSCCGWVQCWARNRTRASLIKISSKKTPKICFLVKITALKMC